MISDQSITTDSRMTVYTVEGSTTNLTFMIESLLDVRTQKDHFYRGIKSDAIKYMYDIFFRPNIIEFHITNVTANDTGFYWIDLDQLYELQLSITSMCIVACIMFLMCVFCARQ